MAAAQAEANRKFWDSKAATYNSEPWQQELAAQVSRELHRKLSFIGAHWSTGEQDPRKVRLLDYACGTGMVSRALSPYVNDIRGLDISPNMVDKYNELAKDPDLARRNAIAVTGDLFTDDRPGDDLADDDLFGFDIAAVGLGFHHFASPALAISRLAERLVSGGVVLIIDLVDEGQGDESIPADARQTVKTHGFTEADMTRIFNDAGMEDPLFSVMEQPVEMIFHGERVHRKVFLARAMKSTPVETL